MNIFEYWVFGWVVWVLDRSELAIDIYYMFLNVAVIYKNKIKIIVKSKNSFTQVLCAMIKK